MYRSIERYFTVWQTEKLTNPTLRKPLIVRGARQVGKSFSIEAFGRGAFTKYIKLDLEKVEHAVLFSSVIDIKDLLALMGLLRNTLLLRKAIL